MAEWSKAVDLSSIIFGCAGSNPAGDTSLSWRSWLAHFAYNEEVAGSSPAGSTRLENDDKLYHPCHHGRVV